MSSIPDKNIFVTATPFLPASVWISFSPNSLGKYSVGRMPYETEFSIWNDTLCFPVPHDSIATQPDGSVKSLPTSVQIENTTKCNLRCTMCIQSVESFSTKTLTLQQGIYILGNLTNLQSLEIQGTGEPLLDPSFFALARVAADKGIHEIKTTTNGQLLNKKNVDKLYVSGINTVTISLDSADSHIYESIRVGAKWDTLQRNLWYLCSHPERKKLKITFAVTVLAKAVRTLPGILELAATFGIDHVFFNFDVTSWGNGQVANNLSGGGCVKKSTQEKSMLLIGNYFGMPQDCKYPAHLRCLFSRSCRCKVIARFLSINAPLLLMAL
jgi:hypothetical protein